MDNDTKNNNSILQDVLDFKPDKPKHSSFLEVFIDGSSMGNPGPGGAGIVIRGKGTRKPLHTYGIRLGIVTNNQAEFLALKHALVELKKRHLLDQFIDIYSDSQLVIGIFSKHWKANLDLVTEIKSLIRDFTGLRFLWVRGHNGNEGNELADSLAQQAATETRTSLGFSHLDDFSLA